MTAIPATAPVDSAPTQTIPTPRNRLGVIAFGLVLMVMAAPIVVTIVTAIVAVVLAIISLLRRRGRNGLGVWALALGVLPALIGPFLIPVTLDPLF